MIRAASERVNYLVPVISSYTAALWAPGISAIPGCFLDDKAAAY